MNHRMTFDEFQELNARRCREVWAEELRDWTLDDHTCPHRNVAPLGASV